MRKSPRGRRQRWIGVPGILFRHLSLALHGRGSPLLPSALVDRTATFAFAGLMRSLNHAFAVSAVFALGCTSIAGLDGDYRVGAGGTGSTSGTGGSTSGTGGSSSGTGGSASGTGGSSSGTGGTSCTPVGHDEDGDAVDDACDNCPSYRLLREHSQSRRQRATNNAGPSPVSRQV